MTTPSRSDLPPEAAALAAELGLEPLEHEGGLYRQTVAEASSTAIYYLLAGADFSALHRLSGPELYHFYAGSPVRITVLGPGGSVEEHLLGTEVLADQRPQVLVPAGVWQGSSSTGPWSLLGTTMAPPFSWEGFELGDRDALTRAYPQAASRIRELTRA